MRLEVFSVCYLKLDNNHAGRMECQMQFRIVNRAFITHTHLQSYTKVSWRIEFKFIKSNLNEICKSSNAVNHSTHSQLKDVQLNKCFAKTNTYLELKQQSRALFIAEIINVILSVVVMLWCCSIQFHCYGLSSLHFEKIIRRLRAYDEC